MTRVPLRSYLCPALVAGLFVVSAVGCEVTFRVGATHGDDGSVGAGGGNTGGSDSGTGDLSDGGLSGNSGGAGGHAIPGPHPPLTSSSKLDLLFMIDDSSSMAPLQQKMRAKLPHFMSVLKALPGGMPDVHVAVVSSSLGAGKFANVPGCGPNTQGNVLGAFQHSSVCSQLNAGQSFLISSLAMGARSENFAGDITDVFSCIANLGDKGCGFEHPFEAVRLALQRSMIAGDPNEGFLRTDAMLGIVMLTNEDDCSVPADSDLLDPGQQTLADPYGGLQSYRCNEFGHRCDQPLPHAADGLPVTLTGCTSKEDGKLVTVSGFVEFLFSLKPNQPEKIFVAAIAGPPASYAVDARAMTLGNGGMEFQPTMRHSCISANATEYADPAVRVKQWTEAFGPNSVFASICADDYENTMVSIAQRMVAIP